MSKKHNENQTKKDEIGQQCDMQLHVRSSLGSSSMSGEERLQAWTKCVHENQKSTKNGLSK